MNVLFNCNNTAFQSPGGGEILLLKTKEFLNKEKVNVKLFDQWNDKLQDFNILHNFGLSKNCYDLINITNVKKIPIVLTPIYSWPSLKFAIKSGHTLKNKINLSFYALYHNINFLNKYTIVKKILEKSNKILPDSNAEIDLLIKKFKIKKEKFQRIPNGVDEKFYNSNKKEFIDKFNLEDFVLYVGRIESRKNVLNLIKIFNHLNIKLVIIGDYLPQSKEYYDLCKKLAKKNIHFLGKIDHESSLLKSAYAAAKVVVLPSWLETPGLSALEGGLAGANIVITSRGSACEYFRDYAYYINPFDNNDIKNKILKAFNNEKNKGLKEHIKKNFLWSTVAKHIKEVYRSII
jgi:glycosyltransferase involved in cell wall biosynthesis